MALLLVLSFLFAAVGYAVRRTWAIAVPFALWIAVAGLGELGVLSGRTSLASALLAGGLGALFTFMGLAFPRLHRRPAAPGTSDTRDR